MSILLRFMDSDYSFGNSELFLKIVKNIATNKINIIGLFLNYVNFNV
jgi:hypothetical protein